MQFIAKIEMAMGCRGVVRREVGVKCCWVQGCCVDVRSVVTSGRNILYVKASEKTKRVGAAAPTFLDTVEGLNFQNSGLGSELVTFCLWSLRKYSSRNSRMEER